MTKSAHTVALVISGGQTGADRGGLDAAIQLGITHGGYCPKGRRAEDGRIPDKYALVEHSSSEYPPRTRTNVSESDGTIVFFAKEAGIGSQLTIKICCELRKPCLPLDLQKPYPRKRIREWLAYNGIHVLNVAGTRESHFPGIQSWVRKLLVETLREPFLCPRRPSGAVE